MATKEELQNEYLLLTNNIDELSHRIDELSHRSIIIKQELDAINFYEGVRIYREMVGKFFKTNFTDDSVYIYYCYFTEFDEKNNKIKGLIITEYLCEKFRSNLEYFEDNMDVWKFEFWIESSRGEFYDKYANIITMFEKHLDGVRTVIFEKKK